MTWEYIMTKETETQSLSHEAFDGRQVKKVFSFYKTFILSCLLFIIFLKLPSLGEMLFLLFKYIITVVVILVLLLLFVQKLQWPAKSEGSVNTMLGFCKITARNGWFGKETTYTDGRVHRFFMPFHTITNIIGIDNGILIEFSGRQYCFIHACAFSNISLEESLAFLEKERKLYAGGTEVSVSQIPPFMKNPIVSDISVMSVSYTLSEDQAGALFSEGYRALPRHLSYWKAFRKFYLYFALLFALSLFFRSLLYTAFTILFFIGAVAYLFLVPPYKARQNKLANISLFCDSFHIELCIEGLKMSASNFSAYLPYSQFFDVYKLNSCFCLLHSPQTFRIIPKTAFFSKDEENMFYQTLKSKIHETNKA